MNILTKWTQRLLLEILSVVLVFAVLHIYVIGPQLLSASKQQVRANHLTPNAKEKGGEHNKRSKISPVIPELVHFIWIYPPDTELEFHQMVCMLSVMKNIKPKGVIFWNNNRPVGKWWLFARQIIPNMALWELEPVTRVFNNSVSKVEHQSDISRIDILQRYGGIYIDFDVIILKPLSDFYKYDITMGAETPNLLGSGIIITKRNSTFLNLWKDTYRTFNDSLWNYHSVVKPMQIAKQNPSIVHIEWFGFHRPNWFERQWLYTVGKLWKWSENYAVHLWYRSHGGLRYNPFNIRCLNTTTGEVLRYIYYGNDSFVNPC